MTNVKMQLDVEHPVDELPEMETLLDAQSSGMSFPNTDQWSVRGGLFDTGPSSGVELIELCNGPMTVSILPTRGMGIWKARLGEIELGWNSPVRRPMHPQFVDLQSRNGLGWLDGFNELLCRCGLAFNGPPGHDEAVGSPVESHVTLHGKIANLPALSVEAFADGEGEGAIGISGIVEECTLFGPQLRLHSMISMQPGSHAFVIQDVVTNIGAAPTELELLYHTNFGRPFLEAGATFHAPTRTVVPRDARAAEDVDRYADLLGPTAGYTEQVYFFGNILAE